MQQSRLIRMAGTLALGAVLTACASTDKQQAGSYGDLYDGRSKIAFGTEFPVISPEDAERRAEKALREGDLDRALFEFVRALEFDGERPDTLYRVGLIHLERDNADLAELAFRMALQVDPKHLGTQEELGLMLLRARRYDQALDHLTRVVYDDHRRWRAYNGLGVIADLQGRHAVAKLHYASALRAKANEPSVLNNLGYSNYLAGDFASAIDAFRRVLERDQGNNLAWRNLGLVQAREGRYEQAQQAFERTMDRPSAYNNVGYIAMLQGDYKRARAYFKLAAELNPSYYTTAFENMEHVDQLSAQAVP